MTSFTYFLAIATSLAIHTGLGDRMSAAETPDFLDQGPVWITRLVALARKYLKLESADMEGLKSTHARTHAGRQAGRCARTHAHAPRNARTRTRTHARQLEHARTHARRHTRRADARTHTHTSLVARNGKGDAWEGCQTLGGV